MLTIRWRRSPEYFQLFSTSILTSFMFKRSSISLRRVKYTSPMSCSMSKFSRFSTSPSWRVKVNVKRLELLIWGCIKPWAYRYYHVNSVLVASKPPRVRSFIYAPPYDLGDVKNLQLSSLPSVCNLLLQAVFHTGLSSSVGSLPSSLHLFC